MNIEQIWNVRGDSLELGLIGWLVAILFAAWLIQKLVPGFWRIVRSVCWWCRCKFANRHRWHKQERIAHGRVLGVTLRCHVCNLINDGEGVTFS